ncbi:hypothetical protein C7212DRAFT_99256, partial [Tuber magnatum]
LNWSFQANTKSSQKIPKDWEQECYETFLRLVFLIYTEQILKTSIVNHNHSSIVLIRSDADYTYEEWRSNQVAIHRWDKKCVFISLISTRICGVHLPTQLVWTGKMAYSLPTHLYCKQVEAEAYIFSNNPNNYWCSFVTMKECFEKII